MKAISNLVFEIKMPKIAKQKAAEILTHHKHAKVYVINQIPESQRLDMDCIIGYMGSFIPLNNKGIVRLNFDSKSKIVDSEFEFVKLPHDGYVLVPVKA